MLIKYYRILTCKPLSNIMIKIEIDTCTYTFIHVHVRVYMNFTELMLLVKEWEIKVPQEEQLLDEAEKIFTLLVTLKSGT